MRAPLHDSKSNFSAKKFFLQVVFPLVGLVAIGWILIIIGFGIETNQEFSIQANEPIRYSWWMVILVTPFMLVMAVVQAAIDNNRLVMNIIGAIVSSVHNLFIQHELVKFSWSTILNSHHLQTTFLSALFLTGLGFLLTTYGQYVDYATQLGTSDDSASLQFSGAIIAAIFWVS